MKIFGDIESIREAVRTLPDDRPFALLPVRLETRFVTSETWIVGPPVEGWYAAFAEITAAILASPAAPTAANWADWSARLRAVEVAILQHSGFTRAQKARLLELFGQIQKAFQPFLPTMTEPESIQFLAEMAALDSLLKNLPAEADETYFAARELIDEMDALLRLVRVVAANKMPYSTPKNRRQLHAWLDALAARLRFFYRLQDDKMAFVKSLDKTQFDRIAVLHEAIKTAAPTMPGFVFLMHKDEKWGSFSAAFRTFIEVELPALFHHFEVKTLGYFAFLLSEGSRFVRSEDLVFQAATSMIRAAESVKKGQPKNFTALKKERVSLVGMAATLGAMSQKEVQGAPESIAFAQKMSASVASALQVFEQKAEAFSPKRKSQKHGRDKAQKAAADNRASLETWISGNDPSRFFGPKKQTRRELWVRIYPDDVHVWAHDERISPSELAETRRFWLNYWRASGDEDLLAAAWSAFTALVHPNRAGWLARQMRPTAGMTAGPSARLVKLIKNLKSEADRLRLALATDALAALFSKVKPTVLRANLNSLRVDGKNVRDRDQAFLLQKALSSLAEIEGKMAMIHQKIVAATASELAATATDRAVFEEGLGHFVRLRERLTGVPTGIAGEPPRPSVKALNLEEFEKDVAGGGLVFPEIAPSKDDKMMVQPTARALPERFVVLLRSGGAAQYLAVGQPLPTMPLPIGIDPSATDFFKKSAENPLDLPDSHRWMSDFDAAVAVGMGLRIPLEEADFARGFDQVVALGVRANDLLPMAEPVLKSLFENHRDRPDGFSFLPFGTPTNNAATAKAGHSPLDAADRETILEPNFSNQIDRRSLARADGQRLAEALGLPNETFFHVKNAGLTEVSDAVAMNRALWNATVGMAMDEQWDTLFTFDNINRTRDFFEENVLGRGVLPALRVGRQPYGAMVTTAFSKFRAHPTDLHTSLPPLEAGDLDSDSAASQARLQLRFDLRLPVFLQKMQAEWARLRGLFVAHAHRTPADGNAQKQFVEMLGLLPRSVDFDVRYAANSARTRDEFMAAFAFSMSSEFRAERLFEAFNQLGLQSDFQRAMAVAGDWPLPPADLIEFSKRFTGFSERIQKSRQYTSRFLEREQGLGAAAMVGKTPDEKPLDRLENFAGNCIDWLLAQNIGTIYNGNEQATLPAQHLLFQMMRLGLLAEYRLAAGKILVHEKVLDESFLRRIGSAGGYSLPTTWDKVKKRYDRFYYTPWTNLLTKPSLIAQKAPRNWTNRPFIQHLDGGEKKLVEYLHPLRGPKFQAWPGRAQHEPFLKKIEETRAALAFLSPKTTAQLARLGAEHLDLASYRLDAWQLGLASKRLAEQRGKTAAPAFVGAYGYVENLRPDQNRSLAANLPPELLEPLAGERRDVLADPDNDGFIHAPSLGQAVAAAILRSGFRSTVQRLGELGNRLAVNLSSRRVRKALDLLDAARAGLDVGMALGAQFERGLHESYQQNELDKYILPIRDRFPLVLAVGETTPVEDKEHYVARVVDGQKLATALLEAAGEERGDLFEILAKNGFSKCPPLLRAAIESELTAAENREKIFSAILREAVATVDSLDALADLMVGEGVYQIAQGNHERAAAVLSGIGDGRVPAELEFIQTPRSGITLEQKMVVAFDPVLAENPLAPMGWPMKMSPRALAEPTINRWLAERLPEPSRVVCRVSILEQNQPARTVELTAAELGWQAIDWVLTSGDEAVSERETRAAWAVFSKENLFEKAASGISISVDWKSKTAVTALSFWENEPLLIQLREILADARALDGRELDRPAKEPNEKNPGFLNLDLLEKRLEATLAAFEILTVNFEKATADDLPADFDPKNLTRSMGQKMQLLLLEAAEFGLDGAIGQPSEGARELIARFRSTAKTTRKRLDEATVFFKKESVKKDARLAELQDAARAIFGKTMLVLPFFKLPNAPEIRPQLADLAQDELLRHGGNAGLAMEEWLQSVAPVRKKMWAIETAAMVGGRGDWGLKVAQLPRETGDFWLGREYPPEFLDGKLPKKWMSMVFLNAENVPKNKSELGAGIVLDEWTEIIPTASETTGIAFNYDQPDGRPPQSILVAVTPIETGRWEWDDLADTILDTIELAKNRLVEPEHVEKGMFAQALPAVLTEVQPVELSHLLTQVFTSFSMASVLKKE